MAFVLAQCQNTPGNKDVLIRGSWQAIINDSVYTEVIITDHDFYVYDEDAGDLLFDWKISNDSLFLYQDGKLYIQRRLIWSSNNKWILKDSLFKIEITPLNFDLDTARLLTLKKWKSGKFDEEYYNDYICSLRKRRHQWDSTYNNRHN